MMTYRFLFQLPLFALLLLVTGCGGFKAYNITKISYDPHGMATLPNGLKVLVVPNPEMAKTIVTVRYQVGGAHTVDGKEGLPHLVEHLAFRVGDRFEKAKPKPAAPTTTDAATTPNQAKEETASKEKSPPVVVNYLVQDNAWTSMDSTFYYKEFNPVHLEFVLADFSQQMGDFSKHITKEVLETERDVVRNERRSSYEGDPLDRAYLDIHDELYSPDHPYYGSNIGSHETINSITLDDISKFLKAHYHPANAILTVTGPVDIPSTWALLQKHFAEKEKRSPSTLDIPDFEPQEKEKIITVKDADTTMVTVIWPLGKGNSDITRQLDLVNRSAGGWFYYKLDKQFELSQWVSAGIINGEHGALYVVRARLKDHTDAQSAKDSIIDIGDTLGRWVDKTWLGRAKRKKMYRSVYHLENPLNLAVAMGDNIYEHDKPMAWVDNLNEIKAIEFKVARDTTWEKLDSKNAIVMIHTPRPDLASQKKVEAPKEESEEDGSINSTKSDEDVAKSSTKDTHEERKSPRQIYQFTQPYDEHYTWARDNATFAEGITQHTLPNGLKVMLKQDSKVLPVMAASVRVQRAPDSRSQPLAGVAGYSVNSMRLSSAVDRENVSRIARYSYNGTSTQDLRYTEKFLSMYAEEGLRILSNRLESPKYSWKSISTSIEEKIEDWNDNIDDIDTITHLAYWEMRSLDTISPRTSIESLNNLSLWKIKDFQEKHFYPENMTLALVGKRPVEEMLTYATQAFGSWSPENKKPFDSKHVSRDIPAMPQGQIYSVPMKSSQSKIRIVLDSVGSNDWKKSEIYGGIRKLLYKKLRDLRSVMGVTYGVNVSDYKWRHFGNIVIQSKVQRDATDNAVEKLLELLDQFRDTPITAGEFEYLKRSIFNDRASRGYGSDANERADRLTYLENRGIPLDIDRRVIDYWHNLKLEEFQSVVDKFTAQTGSIIVVGEELKNAKERSGRLSRYKGELVTYTPEELIQ